MNPSNSLSPSNAWMVVYIASSEPEAYIVAGRLNSEGIETFVHQEPVAKAYGFSGWRIRSTQGLVPAEDYDRALEIPIEDVEAAFCHAPIILATDEFKKDYDDEYDDNE